MSFFSELRRRNVFRVAGVYALAGWVLAQIANTLEESLTLPSWFDGVIVALLLIGFPIALIFAWAFEMTPEGVVRTESVPDGESITNETARKLDFAIVASLILLVIVLAWGQVNRHTQAPVQESANDEATAETLIVDNAASIAVLPFADLSPEGDQEYFSDGLAEEILNVLVAVDGLDVASRTSSFQFKGRDLGIPDIATELKVRHVVEGSVRKSGDTIRVTAQLIDSRNDKHLWSNTYDRPLSAENIFAIQDDIARSIVDALSDALGLGTLEEINVTAKTRNLPAYELYLRARPLVAARSGFERVESYLAAALIQDPQFAEAWELRAVATSLLEEYRPDSIGIDEVERLATEYANRALAINPNSGTAIAVLAKLDIDANDTLRRKHPIADSISRLDRALEINSHSSNALNWRGRQYMLVGDFDSALRDFRTCTEFEPYHTACATNLIFVMVAKGNDVRSFELMQDAVDKGVFMLEYVNFGLLARLGKEDLFKAISNSRKLLFGWHQHAELYEAFLDPGADHSQLIESVLAHTERSPQANKTAIDLMLFSLGRHDIDVNPVTIWGPAESTYRRGDLFKTRMRENGAHAYWREFGFPDKCRPVGEDDFECD